MQCPMLQREGRQHLATSSVVNADLQPADQGLGPTAALTMGATGFSAGVISGAWCHCCCILFMLLVHQVVAMLALICPDGSEERH
jgi:hypothetical protein